MVAAAAPATAGAPLALLLNPLLLLLVLLL